MTDRNDNLLRVTCRSCGVATLNLPPKYAAEGYECVACTVRIGGEMLARLQRVETAPDPEVEAIVRQIADSPIIPSLSLPWNERYKAELRRAVEAGRAPLLEEVANLKDALERLARGVESALADARAEGAREAYLEASVAILGDIDGNSEEVQVALREASEFLRARGDVPARTQDPRARPEHPMTAPDPEVMSLRITCPFHGTRIGLEACCPDATGYPQPSVETAPDPEVEAIVDDESSRLAHILADYSGEDLEGAVDPFLRRAVEAGRALGKRKAYDECETCGCTGTMDALAGDGETVVGEVVCAECNGTGVGSFGKMLDDAKAEGAREERDALLQNDKPWPLESIVERLANSVQHYLITHDCDHNGWEEAQSASIRADEWLAFLRARSTR